MRTPRSSELDVLRKRLLDWYRSSGRTFLWRRRSASRYQQMLSELLLQRTRADVVALHLPGILIVVPSWRVLAYIPKTKLGRVLKPLGLWRRRTTSLRNLAREVMRRRGKFPRERLDLELLPGVGQYMANAFSVILWNDRAPYLDVNMARVLERNFGRRKLADIRYDAELQRLAHRLTNHAACKLLNWAILDLASLTCLNREPKCEQCPLVRTCRFGRNRSVHKRSVKTRLAG